MAVSGIPGGLPHWAYSCALSLSFARSVCHPFYFTANFFRRPFSEMYSLPSIRIHRIHHSPAYEHGQLSLGEAWAASIQRTIDLGLILMVSPIALHRRREKDTP